MPNGGAGWAGRGAGSATGANPISGLATRSGHWLGQQGRLTEPMVRRRGRDHYEPISWDEAYGLIATRLRELPGPDGAIF